MLSIHEILKKYWGYDAFRKGQEEIIQSILKNDHTIALLPTGGGKSICYQVPAMAIPQKTLVISPLVALMQDQVNNLLKVGIKAATLHSGMHYLDLDRTLDNFAYGDLKILYISPERLKSKLFLDRIDRMDIGLLVIDEAHCISQWGYDFRPSYLEIASIKTLVPDVKIVALTATATDMVIVDIIKNLELKKPQIFRQSFTRDNLGLFAIHCQDKYYELSQFLKKTKGSIIIYVRNRKNVVELARWIHQQSISCVAYHAGMEKEKRENSFHAWMNNLAQVIVCTNAFGMGIDKADVRMVIHLDLPPSIEEYYQEVGRAGRDQKMAYGIILLDDHNYSEALKNFEDQFPNLDFISLILDQLYDYYEIDYGGGQYAQHIFSIGEFSRTIQQPLKKVHYALNILEREGWILQSEALKEPSRIMIKCDHTQLRFTGPHEQKLNQIIVYLLRNYEGLFVDLVRIDEEKIAYDTSIDLALLIRLLHIMNYDNIIVYNPKVDQPQITFLQPRVIKKSITIDKSMYKERKSQAEKKINSLIRLFKNDKECRQRIIAAYFGEKSTECKKCDNCLAKDHKSLNSDQIQLVLNHLKEKCTEKPVKIRQYIGAYPFNKRGNIQHLIYEWANERIIDIDNQGYITIL
jgi:ATP-dependent DNA helicase RecQ